MQREDGEHLLPPDCWQLIFKNLDEEDLKTVSLACKSFFTNSNLVKESLKVSIVNVSRLSQIFMRFTQLKKVDLSGRYLVGDLDEALCEVGSSGLNLESLNISYRGAPLQTGSLTELVSNPNMKNLKTLSCNWIILLHEENLLMITNSFPSLEELNIGYNKNCYRLFDSFVDRGVEVLTSKLELLKKIHISGNNPISDRSIESLYRNCRFLKDVAIVIPRNSGVTEKAIGLLLRNSPNLEALRLGYIKINHSSSVQSSTITIENSISHAKALTSLEFLGMDISDKLVMAVADSKLRLDYLGIKRCGNVVGGRFWFNYLTKLSTDKNIPSPTYNKIRKLHLECCIISDEGVKQLGMAFPNIKVLDLSFCHRVTSTGIEAILKSCESITELIMIGKRKEKNIIEPGSDLPELNLKVLKLMGSRIDGEGLAVIETKCPQLVDLDLSLCQNVTTKNIKQLIQNIKTLTCLHLRHCDHIDYGDLLGWMLSTGNLASLKKLCLGCAKFTITEEQRDQFLQHGCLLINRRRYNGW